MKNEKNKDVIIIVLIVIIVGLIIATICLVNNGKSNTKNNIEESIKKTTTTTKPIVSNNNDEKVYDESSFSNFNYLIERLNPSECIEINTKNNSYEIASVFNLGLDNLSDGAKIAIAIANICESSGCNRLSANVSYIKYDEVLSRIKKLFGKNATISDKTYTALPHHWTYSSENDAYIYTPVNNIGCVSYDYYFLVISSVKEKNNQLYISVYGSRDKIGSYEKKDGSRIDDLYGDSLKAYMLSHLDEFTRFDLIFDKNDDDYSLSKMTIN